MKENHKMIIVYPYWLFMFQFVIWFFITNLHTICQSIWFMYIYWSKAIYWSQEGYKWIDERIFHIQCGTLCSWMSITNIVCVKRNTIQLPQTCTNYGKAVYLLRIWDVYELINIHWHPSKYKLHTSTDWNILLNILVMNMLIFCTNIYMHIHYGRYHHIYSEENR